MEPAELIRSKSCCHVLGVPNMEPVELILDSTRCVLTGAGPHMEPMELIHGTSPVIFLTESALCTFMSWPITHDRVVPIWWRQATFSKGFVQTARGTASSVIS